MSSIIFLKCFYRIFYAAKALDQCILVCKELGDLREISNLAERAATMFQTHGSNESAVASLDKAAKILETQHPDDALKLYKHAAEIVCVSIILPTYSLFHILLFITDLFRHNES